MLLSVGSQGLKGDKGDSGVTGATWVLLRPCYLSRILPYEKLSPKLYVVVEVADWTL